MTSCLLAEGKHVTLNFDTESKEVSSDNDDFKVRTHNFRTAQPGRKLSLWGNFMSK
jgi:hypothetical protein